MSVMSPQQLVLCVVTPDGAPALPRSVVLANGQTVDVWADHAVTPGEFPIHEFRLWAPNKRDTSRLVLLQLVAHTAFASEQPPAPAPFTDIDGTLVTLPAPPPIEYPTRGLFVAWAPGEHRRARNPVYGAVSQRLRDTGLILARWDLDRDADGDLVPDAFEADESSAATEAKAAWPATWRKHLEGDEPGAPSGACKVGLEIA